MGVLQDLNIISITVRLLLALLCGGLLGLDREKKKRPAGFRTYMLVCMGAALVMITNQYVCEFYKGADPGRLGAQVISGIGFLGAGTIMINGRNQVKGLTTAAGLWAVACVGLAIGIGFYSGAIIGALLIFSVMTLLHKVEKKAITSTKVVNFYIEFERISDFSAFMKYAKQHNIRVSDIEVNRASIGSDNEVAVMLTTSFEKKQNHAELVHLLSLLQGVKYIEEI